MAVGVIVDIATLELVYYPSAAPRGNISVLGLTISSINPTAMCYLYNIAH
jgi:hypothetical protein